MIYFIPAWYANSQWCEQEQYWHTRRMHTEFDDTVKHIQLFHRNRICPFQICLLSYAPNFRHFLHRQSVYHAPYWSCFDAIQGILRKNAVPLSYHNLKWPEGTEFVYSMFLILAMVNGQLYAKIEFGEDGNMIEVEMYENGHPIRKNIYDDRGFLSSTIVYRDGTPFYQDYLGEDGLWRIRRVIQDGRVLVNPKYPRFRLAYKDGAVEVPFRHDRYAELGQLIAEVLTAYIDRTDSADIFCAAVHPLHMPMLQNVFKDRNLIFSLFEERNNFCLSQEEADVLSSAGQLICDSHQGKSLLERSGNGRLPSCTVITPFDTRPDFGISQQMNMQKILVPVDHLEANRLEAVCIQLGKYLLKNNRAEVHLFTRKADYNLDEQLLGISEAVLKNAGLQWDPTEDSSEGDDLFDLNGSSDPPAGLSRRWFAEQCVDELNVSKCLRMQRLIVDFRTVPDVYLRVIAISMGIPQILLRPSEFVISGKNGTVLQNPDDLPQCLSYYLDELSNWNNAMVAAYELGKNFDTATQVKKWKGVIDSFE